MVLHFLCLKWSPPGRMAKKRGSATDRLTEVLTKEIMSVKMKSLSCV